MTVSDSYERINFGLKFHTRIQKKGERKKGILEWWNDGMMEKLRILELRITELRPLVPQLPNF